MRVICLGSFFGLWFHPKVFHDSWLLFWGDFQYLILKVVDIGHFNGVSCMVFAMLWHILPALGLKLKQYIHGDGDLEAQTSKEVHQMITKLTT